MYDGREIELALAGVRETELSDTKVSVPDDKRLMVNVLDSLKSESAEIELIKNFDMYPTWEFKVDPTTTILYEIN